MQIKFTAQQALKKSIKIHELMHKKKTRQLAYTHANLQLEHLFQKIRLQQIRTRY